MSTDELQHAFTLVLMLPNVRTLRIDDELVSELLRTPPFAPYDDDEGQAVAGYLVEPPALELITRSFALLTSRMTTITYDSPNVQALVQIIAWASHLRDFSTSMDPIDGPVEDDDDRSSTVTIHPVADALMAQSHLRTLTLYGSGYVDKWTTVTSQSATNLRSLDVFAINFTVSMWQFVCQFPMLATLKLDFRRSDLLDEQSLLGLADTPHPLAHLTCLRLSDLSDRAKSAIPFFAFFFADPAPSPLIEIFIDTEEKQLDDLEAPLAYPRYIPSTVRRLSWYELVFERVSSAQNPPRPPTLSSSEGARNLFVSTHMV